MVRRTAAARRDRPCAGAKAAAAARGRADRQSRRGHRRRGAGAGARPRFAQPLRLPDGHAQRAARGNAGSPGDPACGTDPVRRAAWTLAVLLSHWRRHPMQRATLLIELIAATALWSGVQALNQQARSSYDRAAAVFGGARTAMLVASNEVAIPQKLFADLRRAGWPVSPVLEGRIQIGGRSFRLLGIEPVTLP